MSNVNHDEINTKGSKDLGLLLKSAREAKKLSLDDVSQVIKIRVNYLKALEEGLSELLPERTYALGYFRAYAKFLEIKNIDLLTSDLDKSYEFLDPKYEEDQKLFLDEEYSLVNTVKKAMSHKDGAKISKIEVHSLKLKTSKKLMISAAVMLILFIFLWIGLGSNNKVKDNQNIAVVNNYTENNLQNDNFVVVKNNELDKENANTPVTNGDNTNKLIEDKKDEVVTKEEVLTKESQEVKKELVITKWPEETIDKTIKIVFKEDVWIRIYKTDDKSVVYLDKIFKTGFTYEVPGVTGISMNVGNYKGVEISVDDTPIYLFSKRKSMVMYSIFLDQEYLLSTYGEER